MILGRETTLLEDVGRRFVEQRESPAAQQQQRETTRPSQRERAKTTAGQSTVGPRDAAPCAVPDNSTTSRGGGGRLVRDQSLQYALKASGVAQLPDLLTMLNQPFGGGRLPFDERSRLVSRPACRPTRSRDFHDRLRRGRFRQVPAPRSKAAETQPVDVAFDTIPLSP